MPSFFAWVEWAEGAAYGPLALKPWEFYKLSPLELIKLVDGYEKRRLESLWVTAYFTCNLMATMVKDVTPAKLMKPFLPLKTKEEKKTESEKFFKEFYAQREEAGKCQQ